MELQTNFQKRCAYQPTGLVCQREEGKDPVIEGVAIVTEQETVLYEGSDWREIEVIDPACITKEVIDNEDIKLNLLHERSASFARSNKREGSLNLDTREDGLHFSTQVPDCDLGKRAKALIANGTYTGCSFEFWAKDYTTQERQGVDGKTEYVVRHTAFKSINALTIAMRPAYNQTSVSVREMIEAEKAQEAEAQAQQAREAEEAAKAAAAAEEQARIEREYQHRKRQLQMKSL